MKTSEILKQFNNGEGRFRDKRYKAISKFKNWWSILYIYELYDSKSDKVIASSSSEYNIFILESALNSAEEDDL